MASLSMEIITSILSLLPVKSLVRFKSVCKTWYSLITSPHFSRLQLNHSYSSGDNRLLILNHSYLIKPECIDPNYSDNHPLCVVSVSLESHFLAAATTFDMPPHSKLNTAQICGSCNGLIIIVQKYILDDICFLTGNFRYRIILWNPMINNYFIIPRIELPVGITGFVSFGFGHDISSDDYKIVRIVDFRIRHTVGNRLSCCFTLRRRQVMVYSLKHESWGNPYEEFTENRLALLGKHGALINNHIVHWIFFDDKKSMHLLRGFDLCLEKWTNLPLPDFLGTASWDTEDAVKDLGVLDGCLCLLVHPEFDNAYVWIMREYGVPESWVKLFSLSETNDLRPLSSSPIAYSKEGDELLVRKGESNGFFWFNLKNKTFRQLDVVASPDAIVCIGSLVPVPKRDGSPGDEYFPNKKNQ